MTTAMTTKKKTRTTMNSVTEGASMTIKETEDAAAWAAGEWAIVTGPRRGPRRAERHTAGVTQPPTRIAWAAGEWAMPASADKKELD